MERWLFTLVAVLYGASFVCEIWRRVHFHPKAERWLEWTETLGFILFTAGIALLVGKAQLGYPIDLRKSIAWLFFAWSLAGANFLTAHLYDNHATGLFTKGWVVGAVALLPMLRGEQFIDYFSSTLSWLNFHRVVFLEGYAFYLLGLPLALNFLWKNVIQPLFAETKDGILDHRLQELDGLHYKMILWALPLLTLGLLTKILMLLETEHLVTPAVIGRTAKEELLPIVAWFTCALYLYTRIFLRWRYNRCAYVYLAGLAIIVAAHYSGRFLLQVT